MFCIRCKYPLEQIESRRCPECGRAFSPTNHRSFLVHPRQKRPGEHSLPRWKQSRHFRRLTREGRERNRDFVSILGLIACSFVVIYALFTIYNVLVSSRTTDPRSYFNMFSWSS